MFLYCADKSKADSLKAIGYKFVCFNKNFYIFELKPEQYSVIEHQSKDYFVSDKFKMTF